MRYQASTGRKSHSQKACAAAPLQRPSTKPSVSRCPRCGKGFKSVSHVLMHLSKSSVCGDAWFTSNQLPADTEEMISKPGFQADTWEAPRELEDPLPSPMSPPIATGSDDSAPIYYTETFPGAGATKGRGQSFMDGFDADQFADQRQSNPFYPFAKESEWQTSSWLLRSGISTRAIDEFFTLPIVSSVLFFHGLFQQTNLSF